MALGGKRQYIEQLIQAFNDAIASQNESIISKASENLKEELAQIEEVSWD